MQSGNSAHAAAFSREVTGSSSAAGTEAIGHHEEHTGCPKREERLARTHHAETDSAGCVVATAARDHNTRDAECSGCFGSQSPRWARPFNEAWHLHTAEVCRRKHCIGPFAPADIQPTRAGRIGHIADLLAGQLQTHVVFGQ